MKKLVFGIFATIFFGSAVSAQSYGESHNAAMRLILPKLDNTVNRQNIFDITIGTINSTIPEYDTKTIYRYSDYTSPYKMLDELLSKKIISNSLYSLAKSDLVNTSSLLDSQAVGVYVDKATANAKSLSSSEATSYLNFLSTMKESSKFWDPRAENGVKYVTNSELASKLPPNWEIKYWACDAVGAIFGGPPGAAAASICYAISIL